MTRQNMERLKEIMRRLRDPEKGCPWDLKQDYSSIAAFTIEEAYELADAIDKQDAPAIKDEVGDLLFHVIFYAQLAEERGDFTLEEIIEHLAQKLKRRHPHVFSDLHIKKQSLQANWEAIKDEERKAKGKPDDPSILADIPSRLPALKKSFKLQEKCARVGFDWDTVPPVLAKVHEEVEEVEQELNRKHIDKQKVEEEIGDLLFAICNLSRHLEIDADSALRKANIKFENRFRQIEAMIDVNEASLASMEAAWQAAKQQEKK